MLAKVNTILDFIFWLLDVKPVANWLFGQFNGSRNQLKKAEGRRRKAEGSVQKGTETLPEWEPPNQRFAEGLKPLLPISHQHGEGDGIKINLLPSASSVVPFLVKWHKPRFIVVDAYWDIGQPLQHGSWEFLTKRVNLAALHLHLYNKRTISTTRRIPLFNR